VTYKWVVLSNTTIGDAARDDQLVDHPHRTRHLPQDPSRPADADEHELPTVAGIRLAGASICALALLSTGLLVGGCTQKECGGGAACAAPSAKRQAQVVITAAMRASGFELHLFPRTEGKRRCTIQGGGPAPGTSFHATCKTRVSLSKRGIYIVYFTHVIDSLPHTWAYAVTPSLHVRFIRDFGPGIAPEGWA